LQAVAMYSMARPFP